MGVGVTLVCCASATCVNNRDGKYCNASCISVLKSGCVSYDRRPGRVPSPRPRCLPGRAPIDADVEYRIGTRLPNKGKG